MAGSGVAAAGVAGSGVAAAGVPGAEVPGADVPGSGVLVVGPDDPDASPYREGSMPSSVSKKLSGSIEL